MIKLRRLNDVEVIVNAELIEAVEAHGTETVISLVTGNHLLVRDSVTDVVQKALEYRKTVYVGAPYLPKFLQKEKDGDKEAKPCH